MEVFCKCRLPEEGSMICCDCCEEWFHQACVNVPSDVWNKDDCSWTCELMIRYWFSHNCLHIAYYNWSIKLCQTSFKFEWGSLLSRKGPYFYRILGTQGHHFHMILGTRVPIFTWNWGPRVPNVGGPHFHMTPGHFFCTMKMVLREAIERRIWQFFFHPEVFRSLAER